MAHAGTTDALDSGTSQASPEAGPAPGAARTAGGALAPSSQPGPPASLTEATGEDGAELVEEDFLIEEISIDAICGVY